MPSKGDQTPCITTPDPIQNLAWAADGLSIAVVTFGTGSRPGPSKILQVNPKNGSIQELAQGGFGGGASIGRTGEAAWIAAGSTFQTAELWTKQLGAPAKREMVGQFNEVFATDLGLILSEDVGEKTVYSLIGPDGRHDLFDVTPHPGATWVSPDGRYVVTLRPNAERTPGGILQVWSNGQGQDQPAPAPLFLIGMTPDRSQIFFSPLDSDSEIASQPVGGGPITSRFLGVPFNSMSISDKGRVAYSGSLNSPSASSLCVLDQLPAAEAGPSSS